ncbi:MAG: lipid-A-disaccharide synthase [Candidatus Binatia bacterium]
MSASSHAPASCPAPGEAGSRTILLVAGEASGDLHGAGLVAALRQRDPRIAVWGVGGARLRAAGMHVLVDTATVATMGFVETFGTLARLLSMYRLLTRFMVEQHPSLLVLVDYPEFNLLLARRAKALGIPVFYYIGPQVWAWRRARVRKIAHRVDRLGVVFPFEPGLYNNGRAAAQTTPPGSQLAEFVGHPLLDLVRPTRSREETLTRYGLDPACRVLALLPGSRKKEIRYLLPPAVAAAQALAREGWQPIVTVAPTLTRDDLLAALDSRWPARVRGMPIVTDDTYNIVHAADAAVVASGTATLETALLGRPMVIMYRVTPLTFALARLLVRVNHIGMPNIILGREVFPELIQRDVTANKLVAAVQRLSARRPEVAAALGELRGKLGQPGAADRAANLALELMA